MVFFFLMIRRPPRSTLSLHDALPISEQQVEADGGADHFGQVRGADGELRQNPQAPGDGPRIGIPAGLGEVAPRDRKSTRLNSSHANISYAVFCLKKKKHRHEYGV